MPYTPKEIRDAVEAGPITEEYRADAKRVIEHLNRLRSTEIASYLQYKQHAYTAVSLLSPGLKGEFAAHADVELQHADMLGERIQQLGGVPVYSPADIARKAAEEGVRAEQAATLADMVVENLMLERRQIVAYTALIREIGDGDPTTSRLLGGILEARRSMRPSSPTTSSGRPRRGAEPRMLVHVIADYGHGDLAFAEAVQRVKIHLPDAEPVLLPVPEFSTLAAGGRPPVRRHSIRGNTSVAPR